MALSQSTSSSPNTPPLRRLLFVAVLATALVLCSHVPSAQALRILKEHSNVGKHEKKVVLHSDLFGFLEVVNGVYGLGDNNATGSARFTFKRKDRGDYSLKYQFVVLNLQGKEPPTKTHIHAGVAGVNGTLQIAFPSKYWEVIDQAPVQKFVLSGKIKRASKAVAETGEPLAEVLSAILDRPKEFYVNLHTAAHPDGAVRGQLYT